MGGSATLSGPGGKTLRVGRWQLGFYHLAVLAIFALGAFVRLYGIGTLYNGLHQDEASIGYDAWAIANYGMDRNGVSLPAYLVAWGSGQNAGYAYLLIPFIKLFGLSLTTLRLPMALAGCVSMWALYTLVRRAADRRFALVALFLFAICPWHILKSRWALESNLFPEMLLWGIALLAAGLAGNGENPTAGGRKRWFYLAFLVFGLSCWAYAISYLVLPLFLGAVAVVLWRKKWLPPVHILGCFGVLVLAAWPIILFALITLFDLPTLRLGAFTIPQMPYPRSGDFVLFADDPPGALKINLKALFTVFTAQTDEQFWTQISGYGLIYLISMPFAVYGFFRSVLPLKKKGGAPAKAAKANPLREIVPGGWMFTILLAVGLFVAVTINPSVVRANTLWMPLVWFWILGVYDLCRRDKVLQAVLAGFYALLFVLMCNTYMSPYRHQLNYALDAGFTEAVRYAEEQDFAAVYVDPPVNQAYIKILYATLPAPQEFRDSITGEEGGQYGTVTDFGRWHCYAPESPGVSGDYAVIVKEDVAEDYAAAGWELVPFGHYYFVARAPAG